MKAPLQWILISTVLVLLTGCRTAPSSRHSSPSQTGSDTNSISATNTAALRGKWHTIVVTPSAKRPKISTWNKLNPVWWFKNADEPVPPWWFRPDEKHRVFKWSLRNPFHNFTFYVIGIADKKHFRSGRYPEHISNPNGGWNFAVVRRRIVYLPMIAYNRGKLVFYFGWRIDGNFGAKITYNARRPPSRKPAALQSTAPSESKALTASGP